jgi:hypothetical protein
VLQLRKDMVRGSYYSDEQDGMMVVGAVLVVGSMGSSLDWRLAKWGLKEEAGEMVVGAVLVVGSMGSSLDWRLAKWGLKEEAGEEGKDTVGSSWKRMIMVDESYYLEQDGMMVVVGGPVVNRMMVGDGAVVGVAAAGGSPN